jgi:hypothetical protein
VLENSKWNYEEIIQYEQEQKETMDKAVLEDVAKSSTMKLDVDIRVWIYIQSRQLWRLRTKAQRTVTTDVVEPLINPDDLTEATPYNCFFLRFPDYSPVFPFRDIKTKKAMHVFRLVSLGRRLLLPLMPP